MALTTGLFVFFLLAKQLSKNRMLSSMAGEPGLAGVYWSKGWWRWWWQLELQVVQSCSQIITTNKPTPSFFTGRLRSNSRERVQQRRYSADRIRRRSHSGSPVRNTRSPAGRGISEEEDRSPHLHSCKQCLKRFSSQSSLQFHFVIHRSKYKCIVRKNAFL